MDNVAKKQNAGKPVRKNQPIKRKVTQMQSGNYSRPFASTFSQSQVNSLILQKANKETSRSYTRYTKAKLQQYIQNPQSNINNIRAVSEWLYRVSMPYRKLIEYYSSMLLYNYQLVPKEDLLSSGQTDFITSYTEAVKGVQRINFKADMPGVIATALRDGAYFGFVYDNGDDECFLYQLEAKYCKVTQVDNGVYGFDFDASFFDQGNNSIYLEEWDSVFSTGYNAYKSNGQDYKWFQIPMETSICIISGNDPLLPLPYLLPLFVSLIDLLDYENLIKAKTELEASVLLLQKIPLLSGTKEINDFAVDLDLVQAMDGLLSEAAPSLAATAYSPCDLEVVSFKTNDTSDTDIFANSLSNLMSKVGVSEMLFNSDKGGSVGLKHSIEVDETVAIDFLIKIERWAQMYIKNNIDENYIIKFHRYTYFTQEDYINMRKDAAALGVPVKMELATSLGYTPYEVMQNTGLENALGLDELWKPLNSSYTSNTGTTDSKGGAEEKNLDDMTEEGIATREENKNGE